MTKPTRKASNAHRKKPDKRRSPSRQHRLLALEISLKLLVYSLLSVTAIVTIAKLLPYQQVQQEKLVEVRHAVGQAQARVDGLRGEFNRNFDPSQSRQVMQEQSPRTDPNQRRIFWLEK